MPNIRHGIMLLFLFGCGAPIADPIPSAVVVKPASNDTSVSDESTSIDIDVDREAIVRWHQQQDRISKADPDSDNRLQSIEIFPVLNHPSLRLAICDYQTQWWGFFGFYELKEGSVAWQAKCENSPTEQSIRWLRGLKLDGFAHPIIEVFGQTHMGNGNLYLYELHDRTLRLLLKTHAVDSHWGDDEAFRDGRLFAEYPDINGDGAMDVVLNGDIDEYKENGKQRKATYRCQKVFLWNTETGMFVEDKALRIGVRDELECDHPDRLSLCWIIPTGGGIWPGPFRAACPVFADQMRGA